ncbi:MAG: D-amino-acid transaminase [Alphaproteobacteria bacterium]
MGRIAYVNGRFVPHADAFVHIEDRGLQFSDGVYEVCPVRAGRLLDEEAHWDRLVRSLGELQIAYPVRRAVLKPIIAELLRRNRVIDGMIYLQVTRGVAPRDHAFPAKARPSIVMTAKAIDYDKMEARAQKGISVRTMPDLRWRRPDIKSISLLPNVLAKQAARSAGAYEAWLVDDRGFVTEGSSSNAWIIDAAGRLITRPLGTAILAGTIRHALMSVAAELQLKIEERAFTVAEAKAAKEAFITAATNFVMPVVEIDGMPIGNGRPGPVALRLRRAYQDKSLI